MGKWFITDFDGTLKNDRNDISKIDSRDLNFIKELKKNGHKIVLATGRPYVRIAAFAKEKYDLEFDYYITNAGGLVVDKNGNTIFKNPLLKDEQDMIMNYLESIRNKITTILYATENEENVLYHDAWTEKMKDFILMEPINEPINYVSNKELLCYKLSCSSDTKDEIINFLKENNLNMNITYNIVENESFMEIHHNNVNKGSAIRGLQSKLSISDSDIYVAGDDYNDISMFEEFYENSYITEQEYNEKIRPKAKYLIQQIFEIEVK
ncbi:Cof-type HAD-IIB family hydrolase [Mesoplasma photuris]|uniref:Cof-type HAD-IIB family hydrolase n=1 Tax=Mesoplasma photuris TaxID=217731 RepID=UPI0004E27BE5|nr:Cof-type HAD-IIB family hydrolase [Mesoplasma photuris]